MAWRVGPRGALSVVVNAVRAQFGPDVSRPLADDWRALGTRIIGVNPDSRPTVATVPPAVQCVPGSFFTR